ncbi:MAG: class I SAM-dependent methyltransferase [bacterium]
MKRLHLIEFGDQEWVPRAAHMGGLEILRAGAQYSRLTDYLGDLLIDISKTTGRTQILDLCSGAGGPLPYAIKSAAESGHELSGVLTDKFPDPDVMREASTLSGGRLKAIEESIYATDVPDDLSGIWTMFNSLHHFKPDVAGQILRDAARKNDPFLSVEFAGCHPLNILSVACLAPASLLLRPFLRPVNLQRWFYTYVVPLIPAGVLFDGLVSCLRIYNIDEMKELTDDIDGMEWDFGYEKPGGRFPGYITYLKGIPK